MPEINPAVRNVVIILLIAGLVDVIPGGGAASNTTLEAIYLLFFGAFVFVGTRLYREYRTSLYSLGTNKRAISYGAGGLIALTLTGTNTLWDKGAGGKVIWLVLLIIAGYALFEVVRSTRRY